jgi:transposase
MKALPHESIERRYRKISSNLSEKSRRRWAAIEAVELGYGGISALSRATGLNARTIRRGIEELEGGAAQIGGRRQRKPGGGRRKLSEKQPEILGELEALVEPYTSGDPMRPLRWTCKSTRTLASELCARGFHVSAVSVGRMLKQLGYSLQSNRRRFEGRQHADRDGQFEYISKTVEAFQSRGAPVISVDAKKKELVGNYENAGREWTPKGCPPEVEAYDFIDREKGKVTPYGIYDTSHNLGWVNVGTDHDTAEFAVRSIGRWWEEMGEWMYPEAREILILADGGGSNGWRSRLWKKCLQKWADREGLKVMVCHFPPGTSKWNKIEHRMFCHITRNWRGRPLVSHEVVVRLIGSTTTRNGLKIGVSLDRSAYPTGIKVSDEEMAGLSIERADFHGEWNYLLKPRVG